ncbi:MAG TPA: tetratricopeptide repeat protein [Steroidobacteraceae bacterium]|nr:tetratricopeptide repeat protein [Steroidobacteraceae bacterium]
MRAYAIAIALAPALAAGCAAAPQQQTLARLHAIEPDVAEVPVTEGLEQAMQGYRRFLEETPETELTPEAMRRLADLQLERQFGIRAGDGRPREMAAPERAPAFTDAAPGARLPAPGTADAEPSESEQDFERRTTAAFEVPAAMPGDADAAGPLEAIALYDRLLKEYPDYEHNDKVLYQKARAYDELGRTEEAMETMVQLISRHPQSAHYDEVQFRRAEFQFTRRQYRAAEDTYSTITALGPDSTFYELALYKLGWSLYKQEQYEEALHKYVALLDHKVSIGYDFDQQHEEEDERRVTDTFRVISLSFSYLGGSDDVRDYFSAYGHRSYEDRVYQNLGEYYLSKLRYDDAAKTYRTFVELNPFHRAAPHFGMRVVEIFTQGGFPMLVLEAKKDFATRYGLQSEYWRHHAPGESPAVLALVKGNLKDLANHYHAEYQNPALADQQRDHYAEARHWYGEYLASFPSDPEAPAINYQLADLLLEQREFGEAAREYERTAYDYPAHERSAAAGYAAVFAHREQLKVAGEALQETVQRDTITSSLRFADTFPQHEHAAAVLGAAADGLYELKDLRPAIDAARRVIDDYPGADAAIRRSAWIVVAHGSFDLAEYAPAEQAYAEVLAMTPAQDDSHAAFVDNLAASIYRQGELANAAQDYRAAADHFLRIRRTAPTSAIRATAEYDAGAALMRLEDWNAAAGVLEAFRQAHPEHELEREATRQIALAYHESGQHARAADEYDRIASEATDPAVRADALLVAGDLYTQAAAPDRALAVYARYVAEFAFPVDTAVETHFKMASIHQGARDQASYHQELSEIVRIDAAAGADRTDRTRTLAARSALVLSEQLHGEFVAVQLLQPFEASLQEKKRLMDQALESLAKLVDYEVAEVTAAATYYMAETYNEFSRALTDSQRPTDLEAAELEEYELALEEEAFPFEEKAIDVHEKNLELLRAGIFNVWTERSLGRLAVMMPGRYAKNEISSGFLGSIGSYAYRSPAPPQPAPPVIDERVTAHANPQ